MPASFPSGYFLFESCKKWHWFKKKHENGGSCNNHLHLVTGTLRKPAFNRFFWKGNPHFESFRQLPAPADLWGNSLTHWPLGTLGENFCCVYGNYGYQVILRWDPIWAGCHVCWCLFKKNFPSSSFTHFQWLVYGVWLAGLLMWFLFLQYIDIHRARKKLCLEQVKLWCPLSHRISLSQRQQYKPTAEREKGASMFPNLFIGKSFTF